MDIPRAGVFGAFAHILQYVEELKCYDAVKVGLDEADVAPELFDVVHKLIAA